MATSGCASATRRGTDGAHAGFISYEAAGAFDSALKTHAPGVLPLLQFGLFKNVEQTLLSAHSYKEGRQECLPHYELGEWAPSVSRGEYSAAIEKIKEHIAAGDTYQVNYTFRLNAAFSGSPGSFFCDLAVAHRRLFLKRTRATSVMDTPGTCAACF